MEMIRPCWKLEGVFTISPLQHIKQGVKQGAVVSLLLYSLFVNDLLVKLTLQFVLAKVFEKIILLRLLDSNLHNHIHPLQGGLKPDVSCLHMAFVFQEAIQHLRDQKKKAYVALLDVQKAFDTVWHNGLLHKLYSYDIKDHTWRILRKWYQSITCTVLWDGERILWSSNVRR